MKIRALLIIPALALLLSGCASIEAPQAFLRYNATGWTALEVRNDVSYDRAWKVIVGILVRKFDLEFLSKEEGYLRTAWLHTWSGVYLDHYRVRITVLFSEDRKTIQLKPEAQFRDESGWVEGADSRLLPSLKAELVGTIGRTLR
jgi:hypothetical protein